MADDMHPVTRKELREELANHPTKDELREELAKYPTKDELREELAHLREDLSKELAKYPTKDELREVLASYATKTDLQQALDLQLGAMLARMDARLEEQRLSIERGVVSHVAQAIASSEQRLMTEMARLARAIDESLRSAVSAVDEKYRDTPRKLAAIDVAQADHEQRLVRLEAAVFPAPTPRKRARRRG